MLSQLEEKVILNFCLSDGRVRVCWNARVPVEMTWWVSWPHLTPTTYLKQATIALHVPLLTGRVLSVINQCGKIKIYYYEPSLVNAYVKWMLTYYDLFLPISHAERTSKKLLVSGFTIILCIWKSSQIRLPYESVIYIHDGGSNFTWEVKNTIYWSFIFQRSLLSY